MLPQAGYKQPGSGNQGKGSRRQNLQEPEDQHRYEHPAGGYLQGSWKTVRQYYPLEMKKNRFDLTQALNHSAT
jgi:hypothetical protein